MHVLSAQERREGEEERERERERERESERVIDGLCLLFSFSLFFFFKERSSLAQ